MLLLCRQVMVLMALIPEILVVLELVLELVLEGLVKVEEEDGVDWLHENGPS